MDLAAARIAFARMDGSVASAFRLRALTHERAIVLHHNLRPRLAEDHSNRRGFRVSRHLAGVQRGQQLSTAVERQLGCTLAEANLSEKCKTMSMEHVMPN